MNASAISYERRIVEKLRRIALRCEDGVPAKVLYSNLLSARYDLAGDFEAAGLSEAYRALVAACKDRIVAHWMSQDHELPETDATLALKLALALRQVALGIELGTAPGGHDGPNLASHPIEPGGQGDDDA
jgi:hypothetical protein